MKLLKSILGSQTVIGCLLISVLLVVFVGGAYTLLSGVEDREQALYDLNGGFGSGQDPIASGEWVHFNGYRLRFPSIRYQATPELLAMDNRNEAPNDGIQQIMLRVEVECQKETCYGEGIVEQLEVITDDRMPRGETPVYILDDDLKGNIVSNGETFSGWVVFRISEDHEVRLIEITDFDERVSLYVFAPPPGS